MIDQPTAGTGTIARPTAVGSRQRGLVPPHPPGDDEKYLYIERNLLYLTTVIFIGSCCLIYSQIRFETHDLVLAPFLLFTAVYVIYQAISLPVNFAGRGFDLAAHQARHPGVAPGVLSGGGHLPAHLRRADRVAPQHLDRRGRADGGVPGRGAGLRPGRRAVRRGPRDGRVASASAISTGPDCAGRQEGREPAVRLLPDQRRVPGHPGRRFRAAARLPGRDAALLGRSPDRDRADAPVLPRAARRRPGSRRGRGRSRRCSTGRSRWPGTGWTPPSAAAPPRSTGGPRWSRRAARR